MKASAALPSRKDVLQEAKARGEKIAAVYPIHYPRALFRAFGVHPIEIWGPPGLDTTKGDAHIQAYACSIVRNGLAFLLNGGLDAVDMILVPHVCDSLQGLGSLLIDFTAPKQPVLTLYFPRAKRPSDKDFLEQELKALGKKLEEITRTTPTPEAFAEAIRLEDRASALQREIVAQRPYLAVSDAELYRVLRSREYLFTEGFIDLAVATLEDRLPVPQKGGIPLLLSGYIAEPLSLLETLSAAGGRVVADDLAACSRRWYPAGTSEDPYRRLAESILAGPPDPMLGASVESRIEYLVGLAAGAGVKGVVFYEIKFCEPELFQLPLVRQGLDAAGLPSVVVEVDINDPLPQQVVTRLEAFVEMIGG